MKNWPALVLVVVGLAYVIGAQFLLHERRDAQESAVGEAMPAPPRPKAAPKAPARDRAWAFGGYPCRGDDCSEDWAGYRWAKENHIADPDDCTGKTGAFIEGCRVYARQQIRHAA